MFEYSTQAETLEKPHIKWPVVFLLALILIGSAFFGVREYLKMYGTEQPPVVENVVLNTSKKTPQPTDEEIKAQLEALSEQSKKTPQPTDEEIKAQLEALSN
jgi:uncharacterized protein YneF (UPF0154 family)